MLCRLTMKIWLHERHCNTSHVSLPMCLISTTNADMAAALIFNVSHGCNSSSYTRYKRFFVRALDGILLVFRHRIFGSVDHRCFTSSYIWRGAFSVLFVRGAVRDDVVHFLQLAVGREGGRWWCVYLFVLTHVICNVRCGCANVCAWFYHACHFSPAHCAGAPGLLADSPMEVLAKRFVVSLSWAVPGLGAVNYGE